MSCGFFHYGDYMTLKQLKEKYDPRMPRAKNEYVWIARPVTLYQAILGDILLVGMVVWLIWVIRAALVG
jgi:hypothetical protein